MMVEKLVNEAKVITERLRQVDSNLDFNLDILEKKAIYLLCCDFLEGLIFYSKGKGREIESYNIQISRSYVSVCLYFQEQNCFLKHDIGLYFVRYEQDLNKIIREETEKTFTKWSKI